MPVDGPDVVAIVCNCGTSDLPFEVPDGYVADLEAMSANCAEGVHRVPAIRVRLDARRMRSPPHTDEAN